MRPLPEIQLSVGDSSSIDILLFPRRLSVRNETTHLEARTPNHSFRTEGNIGILEVELPGVKVEDVDIEIDGTMLIVTAKRHICVQIEQPSLPPSHSVCTDSESKRDPLEGLIDYSDSSSDESDDTLLLQTGGEEEDNTTSDSPPVHQSPETVPPARDQRHHSLTIYRSVFALDSRWNPEEVKVREFEDGILCLSLGKAGRQAPRKIEIQ